nr:MAG TPA: hypothetical protein [Caudoviricetes sp.]
MRHLWKSYGLAHFCTIVIRHALCVFSKVPLVSSITWAKVALTEDVVEA